MNCGSCYADYSGTSRNFFTKNERLEMLKEYKNTLDKESKGIAEKMKELEKE